MVTLLKNSVDTKLADRTAVLQAASSTKVAQLRSVPEPSSRQQNDTVVYQIASSIDPTEVVAKVRQDLSEAQRSRGLIEGKLHEVMEDLQKLKMQSSLKSKHLSELGKEKASLIIRLKDCDEELKGKTKLLEVFVLGSTTRKHK